MKAESVMAALQAKYTKDYNQISLKKDGKDVQGEGDREVNLVSSAAEKKRIWRGEKGVFNKDLLVDWYVHMKKK